MAKITITFEVEDDQSLKDKIDILVDVLSKYLGDAAQLTAGVESEPKPKETDAETEIASGEFLELLKREAKVSDWQEIPLAVLFKYYNGMQVGRIYNPLARKNIDTLGKMYSYTKQDYLEMRSIGVSKLTMIEEVLAVLGLRLKERPSAPIINNIPAC